VVEDDGATYPLTIDPLVSGVVWTYEPNQASASLGISVSTAGDVNGDGLSDVIIGQPDNASGGFARVYHGSPAGLPSTADWFIWDYTPESGLGTSCATAGDVNGDGYSDVIVSNVEPDGTGPVYAAYGRPSGLLPQWDWHSTFSADSADYGTCVATAGDVNGDGLADIVVGAPHYDGAIPGQGAVMIFHGSTTGLLPAGGWPAATRVGTQSASRAHVYLGTGTGVSAFATWTAAPSQQGAYFGTSVAAAGDVNGDGFADVIVGGKNSWTGELGEGQARVYYGDGNGGRRRMPRQMRAEGSAPIASLGAGGTSFRFELLGRTAAGRDDVRLEWQGATVGNPFQSSVTGPWVDSGAPAGESAVLLSHLLQAPGYDDEYLDAIALLPAVTLVHDAGQRHARD
jgi:hypothetical protein